MSYATLMVDTDQMPEGKFHYVLTDSNATTLLIPKEDVEQFKSDKIRFSDSKYFELELPVGTEILSILIKEILSPKNNKIINSSVEFYERKEEDKTIVYFHTNYLIKYGIICVIYK